MGVGGLLASCKAELCFGNRASSRLTSNRQRGSSILAGCIRALGRLDRHHPQMTYPEQAKLSEIVPPGTAHLRQQLVALVACHTGQLGHVAIYRAVYADQLVLHHFSWPSSDEQSLEQLRMKFSRRTTIGRSGTLSTLEVSAAQPTYPSVDGCSLLRDSNRWLPTPSAERTFAEEPLTTGTADRQK